MDHNGTGHLVRATTHGGLVRAFAIDSTAVVAELQARQRTEPAVTAALGRLATGALLFSAALKEPGHQVALRVRGGGPAGLLLAIATGGGDVRGLVGNPVTGADQVRNGKLNVAGVVGVDGQLSVTRDLGLGQPYVGVVDLVSGEIGEDLAHYLGTSEQVPSAVGIGVFVRADTSVEAAGGYMVQLLPGVGDDAATEIDSVIRALPHPTAMLRAGDAPEDILSRIFPTGYDLLEQKPIRFHCPCDLERVERALRLLGVDALRETLESDAARGETEVVCEFCAERYTVTTDRMRELIELASVKTSE